MPVIGGVRFRDSSITDIPDPLSDNTASLLAAEALYFTANRGMSEEEAAELLGVSVERLRRLLAQATRHPGRLDPDA